MRLKWGTALFVLWAGCGGTTVIIVHEEPDAGKDSGSKLDAGRDVFDAGPDLAVLATNQAQPFGLALSPTAVYWTNVGTVVDASVVPESGSIARVDRAQPKTPETLVANVTVPQIIQYTPGGSGSGAIVFSAAGPNTAQGSVSVLTLDTHTLTVPGVPLFSPLGVAADEAKVYWLTSNGTGITVEAAPLLGGSVETLGSTLDGLAPGCVALPPKGAAIASTLYFTGFTDTGGGAVYAMPRRGGAIAKVWSTTSGFPYGIAADEDNLYWANEDKTKGSIYELPLPTPTDAGPPSLPLALAVGQPSTFFVAVDKTSVYFTTNVASGGVFKVPIVGGPVTTVLDKLDFPGNVAVDELDDRVYYTTLTTIGSTPK